MSQANPPLGACPTPVTTDVPGTAGVNAFTTTTAPFTVPALGANIQLSVVSTAWIAVGQALFITAVGNTAIGYFTVISVDSATLVTVQYINTPQNTQAGATANNPAIVTPAGAPGSSGLSNPVTIAQGGTNATTKSGAQTNLGLGQAAVIPTPATGLTQAITGTPTQISTLQATTTAAGLYLLLGYAEVNITGATGSTGTVTIQVYDSTGTTVLASATRNVASISAIPISMNIVTPFTTATIASGHSLWLRVSGTGGGTTNTDVVSASLALVPLNLS